MATHAVNWSEPASDAVRGGAVAIGNFDGVHRGHAALIAELCRQAKTIHGPAVVLTFDPHPLALLRPELQLPLLTTPSDRAELLHALGVNHVVNLRPTPELLALSPDAFFQRVLRDSLSARAMVEGDNFRFGHQREGDISTLQRLCDAAQITVTVVPIPADAISSSRIRESLLRGDVRDAADLLGRAYSLTGRVGTGLRRGRTIGFPTANLVEVPTVIPGDGVYAVAVAIDEKKYAGAANIGPNPTFGENERKIEVHVIDYEGDLYGRVLTVTFVDRLRDTRPFGSAAELIAQLRQDVEQARQRVDQWGR
jgi:riboflavin kinase / FMN adenylyltransferase